MADKEAEFLKKYHEALVLANKEDLDKIKPKIASRWVKEWMSELGGPVPDKEKFRSSFEKFLTDELGFADRTAVSFVDGQMQISVEGCMICPGNELLRQAGEPTLCPILSTGLMAINRVLGMKATLLGVDKGDVGFCKIKYAIEPKGGF